MSPDLSRALPGVVRRSYTAKLVAALAGIALVVAVFGGYIYFYTGSALEADTQQETIAAAETGADRLDEWLRRMTLEAKAVSESAAFQSGDRSRVAVQLWNVVDRDEDIEAAYYVDTASGNVITSTGSTDVVSAAGITRASGDRRLTDLAQRSRRAVFVSDPFRPYEGSASVVLFVTGVPGEADRAVVLVVNIRSVSRSLADGSDAEFVVVNRTGRVVMAENGSRILTRDTVAPRRFVGESGFLTADAGGRSTAIGYAALDSRPWTVTVREPTAAAYALRRDIVAQLLGLLGIVLCSAVVIVATFGHSTARSIRRLADKTDELRDGNLEVSVDTDREDELGRLYRAFDEMRRSLGASLEEAHGARRDAERARAEAERARRESERLTAHLERTAERYGAVMQACADGDLARRMDPDGRSAPMAAIAESFNAMMDDVQEQNEQLETVTRVLSHDIRNPLMVALGRAELLADETDSEHAAPLVRSLDRMEDIIADALLLARGDAVDATTPVDLRDAAETAWQHVETDGATLAVPETATVEADPDLLGHVFENLFRNAVEHTGPDVDVEVAPTPDGFAVADDGPGIPPEEREAVFEMGHTTNRDGGGTGLGLAIVDRVAAAHGWEVSVGESETGGARFAFAIA